MLSFVKYVRSISRFFSTFNHTAQSASHHLKAICDNEKISELQKILNEINIKLSADIVSDGKSLSQIHQQLGDISHTLLTYDNFHSKLNDLVELHELANEEKDAVLLEECGTELENLIDSMNDFKISKVISSKEDKSSCFLEIVAGVGGADAFDWAKMLSLMYFEWGAQMNFRVNFIDEQKEESTFVAGGYRRVTLKIEGSQAYGWMKAEAGVHRLVRKSPFDPQGKRHTSFAQVRIYPVPDDLDGQSSFHVKTRYNILFP